MQDSDDKPRLVDGGSMGDVSPRGRALIAAGLIGFALFMFAAAFQWIDVRPSRGVPYWIVAVVGVIAALAGIAVALPQRASRLNDFLGAILFTAFAVVPLWIGFGPGPRTFGGGIAIGPIGFGFGGETAGRVVFGIVGVLVALIAVYAWRRAFRRRD